MSKRLLAVSKFALPMTAGGSITQYHSEEWPQLRSAQSRIPSACAIDAGLAESFGHLGLALSTSLDLSLSRYCHVEGRITRSPTVACG
jgi:hypothetical protein